MQVNYETSVGLFFNFPFIVLIVVGLLAAMIFLVVYSYSEYRKEAHSAGKN
jgi:hypothetical protein